MHLVTSPKNQPLFFKTGGRDTPPKSWNGDSNVGSEPPQKKALHHHYFYHLLSRDQVTVFETKKVPVAETFSAVLLTPACSAAPDNVSHLPKHMQTAVKVLSKTTLTSYVCTCVQM